jgi:hypothetical protein
MINLQRIRGDLKKRKDILHMTAEGSGRISNGGVKIRGEAELEGETREARETEVRRRETDVTEKIALILKLLSPKKIEEYFGMEEHEVIWETFNTRAEHQDRVIE